MGIVVVAAARTHSFADPKRALLVRVVYRDNKRPKETALASSLPLRSFAAVELQEPDIEGSDIVAPAHIAVPLCIAVVEPFEVEALGPDPEPAKQAKTWQRAHFAPDMSVEALYIGQAHFAQVLLVAPKASPFCWQMETRCPFARPKRLKSLSKQS